MRESSWAFPDDSDDYPNYYKEEQEEPSTMSLQTGKRANQDDTITAFFECQISPTQRNCDTLATAITYLPHVTPLQHQGRHSYTVLCSSQSTEDGNVGELPGGSRPPHTHIIQFRAAEFTLDMQHVLLARKIHGGIVPETRFHSIFNGKAERGPVAPLHVYVMEHMVGSPVAVVKPAELNMRSDEEKRMVRLMRDFARFSATTYNNPLPSSHSYLAATRHSIESALSSLALASRITSHLALRLSSLRAALPAPFAPSHPQVLAHNCLANPLSGSNKILVDPLTGALTGIVGWHAAAARPFGFDLCALDAMLGTWCGGQGGRGGEWRWCTNRRELEAVFWAAFWTEVGVEDGRVRKELEERIVVARGLGAVTTLVGERSWKEEGMMGRRTVRVLEAWLCSD